MSLYREIDKLRDRSETQLLLFLSELRDVPEMEELFLHGNCYRLWKIVRTIWPDARPMHDPIDGHVYIELWGKIYDIRGRNLRPPKLEPLDHTRRPDRWGFSKPER